MVSKVPDESGGVGCTGSIHRTDNLFSETLSAKADLG